MTVIFDLRLKADDTIVAISSAVGPAARMIVRVSGPESHRIATTIASALPPPGSALRCQLRFADLTTPGWVYLFAGPRSYTGEDLVEFHITGNPLLARLLLDAIVALGARHAEAGEFTARAYFAGRMDLAEAEGVAATIGAHSEQELRAARQLMAGELSRRLRPAMDAAAETLALVEAGIDFSEEDVSFISGDEIDRRVGEIDALLDDLVSGSARFEPQAHEPTFVLVGGPNAGKSTLLNALAGRERAVVSPVAGTTRDILSAEVRLRRGIVRVSDVAGIEEALSSPVPSDPSADIERQMQQQARRALESADRVILVREVGDQHEVLQLPREADVVVRTKTDLVGATLVSPSGVREEGDTGVAPTHAADRNPAGRHLAAGAIHVSAKTGEGMGELREALDRLAFGETSGGGASSLALNARHLGSIAEARSALSRARSIARDGGAELIALELRESLDALGRVLGQVTPDDVLGRVFATFCIGK
jgi:tRNA modification GTPase